ncbi:MAG TPA: AAA family ATPase [Thermoanaerobaculia bacterium]|nr:AAA family ATPase [Thermoanaerobaculia bacterium]
MTAEQIAAQQPEIAVPLPADEIAAITPKDLFAELRRGVLGQDRALRFVSVAIYKHTTGKVSGNILLIGNSGTGKTTVMNNIQRVYDTMPAYRAFRAVTILNANLLVESERTEFRPDRMFAAVEQRARSILGERPTAAELKEAMERGTVCVDEVDKMSTVVAGKPNPIGVVLQQGLLTLMEGERVPYRTHVWEGNRELEATIEIDTARMMFVCGGAFEGLYDQVLNRVSRPGSGERVKSEAVKTADGGVRIESRYQLADFLKMKDMFEFGMVPQFMARFDKVVVMNDLGPAVLKEILLHSYDSPFRRSQRYFESLGIDLELDDLAAGLIAEQAAKENRTGARALRDVFSEIVNPIEFDPWGPEGVEKPPAGGRAPLRLDADRVRDRFRQA